MALKIRLQRGGKTHAPRYRLVVAEGSAPRDGKFVEILGSYNPQAKLEKDEYKLNLERIDYWMGVGAKPSDTVRTMINRIRRRQEELGETEEKPAAKAEVAPEPVVAEAPAEPADAGPEAETEAETPAGAGEADTPSDKAPAGGENRHPSSSHARRSD